MDIRKIALFLAGKLPPYYWNSNLYKFSKALKRLAPEEFSNDEILFIQQQAKNIDEEVYFMVLDDLWTNTIDKREEGKISKQDIIEMLQKIWVPNEVLGVEESRNIEISWDLFENKAKQIYWKSYSTTQMGEFFEKLCDNILQKNGFINVKVASIWPDWWIDITADKEVIVWTNTKKYISFFGQCKYKSSWNVSKKEVEDLIWVISGDTDNFYQWLLFFTNKKYVASAKKLLDQLEKNRLNIKAFYLDWDEILDIVKKYPDLIKKYFK